MSYPKKPKELYQFGEFHLDAAERRLWRGDERIQLTPKQFDLLFYFVENAGRVAKKSELLDAVWADTFIEETTLARNVSWLRKQLEDGADGELFIETVPKLGYRFTAEVNRLDENAFIIEEQTLQYTRGEETITFDDKSAGFKFRQSFITPILVIMALTVGILAGVGFVNFNRQSRSALSADDLNLRSDQPAKAVTNVDATALKIGAIVNLKNQSSDDAGYLDVWGEIKSKPEFWIVPTEIKFVSTHPNPNRENGSGSWKIVSANGKKDGETLRYGDKIHLQSMYADAGFLDNCGWLKDMPVFRKFAKAQKFAVFTTWSEDRDNGTGTWIVGSNAEYEGNPVLEGSSISLENGFPDGGYLDTYGRVEQIPAFYDYDGSRLVFIHATTPNRRPNSANWTISTSNAVLK